VLADAALAPYVEDWRVPGSADGAWTALLMQQFVSAHSRCEDLARALGFSLGAGRGKVLFQLRQGLATLSQLAESNGSDASYTTASLTSSRPMAWSKAGPPQRRRAHPAGHFASSTADTNLLRPLRALHNLEAAELQQPGAVLDLLVAADELDPLADGGHGSQTARRQGQHTAGAGRVMAPAVSGRCARLGV